MRKEKSAWVFFWTLGGLAFALVAYEYPNRNSCLLENPSLNDF
jgi:hypothetical protein